MDLNSQLIVGTFLSILNRLLITRAAMLMDAFM